MEVHFQNTPDDIAALLRSLPLSRRIWSRAGSLVVVVACCLPATILLAVFGLWHGLAAVWFAIATLCLVGSIVARRSIRAVAAPWLVPMTIRIEPAWLECESGRGFSRRDWSQVTQIHDDVERIFLFVGSSTAFVIPKSAFTSPDVSVQFAAALRRHRPQTSSSHEPRPAPSLPVADAAGTELAMTDSMAGDWQEGMCVDYEVTADQYVSVLFDGLQKSHQPTWPTGSVLIALPWLIGIMLVIFGSGSVWPGQILIAVMTFTLTGIPMLLVTNKLQKSYAIRHCDTAQLGHKSATISPAGLAVCDHACAAFFSWNQLGAIDGDRRFLVFFFSKPHVACLIPKSAFPKPGLAERFQQCACQYKEGSAEQKQLDQPLETGNPYQPPTAY